MLIARHNNEKVSLRMALELLRSIKVHLIEDNMYDWLGMQNCCYMADTLEYRIWELEGELLRWEEVYNLSPKNKEEFILMLNNLIKYCKTDVVFHDPLVGHLEESLRWAETMK